MNDKIKKEVLDLIKHYDLKCEVKDFAAKANWVEFLIRKRLSEDFIREFQYCINWNLVSSYQVLSEEFIEEFKDLVNWDHISRYQKISLDFIKKFKDKINFENLLVNSEIDVKLSSDLELANEKYQKHLSEINPIDFV